MIKHTALRYHGSKFRLAPFIISNLHEHRCYCEPFAGGAGVLLNKPRSYAEIYNDLDHNVVNFFRVLRDQPTALKRLVELTPYSRSEFNLSKEYHEDLTDLELARRFLVRSLMGFGSASCSGDSGFAMDSKRKYALVSHYWPKYISRIDSLTKRLQGVIIENKSAINVIKNHDSADTLFYCDPPYLKSTRSFSNNKCYAHEMTEQDHIDLISTLQETKGHVLLSGYDSDLYNDLLSEWKKLTKESRISAGRGTKIKTECLWIKQ